MAELVFEALALALESDRGSAITTPTHILNMDGTLTPMVEVYYPPDRVGVRAKNQRGEIVRKWAEFEGEGAADVTKMPIIGNMALMPLSAGVLAGGEVTGSTSLVGGSGYVPAAGTFNITVGAPSAGGRQAVVQATTSGGVITALTVIDPGFGYSSAPALGFSGHTGTGASATATVSTRATSAYRWEFIREMTDDTGKTGTMIWGDPNQVVYRAPYGAIEEVTVGMDASGTDGVTCSIKGFAQFPTALTGGSIPTYPAISVSPLLLPGASQLYMNTTASPFGTTAITGRFVSGEVSWGTGMVAKYVAVGPAGGLTFDHTGITPSEPTLKLVFELADQTQYDLFAAGTVVRTRVKFNNVTAIESGIYPGIWFDIEGVMSDPGWGDLEGANRTLEVTITGVYSSQLASDLRMIVINSSASL